MYILNISYSVSPETVAPHVEAHRVWIKKYCDQGIFLAVGPKKSKLGGVILARAMNKAELMKIIAEDSFVKEDVADYQIIDIDCKLAIKGLEQLIDS